LLSSLDRLALDGAIKNKTYRPEHLRFEVIKTRKPYQTDYANGTLPARRHLRAAQQQVCALAHGGVGLA